MKIPIVLASNEDDFVQELQDEIEQNYPDFEAFLPNQQGSDTAILAACWYPDNLILSDFPNLKCLHSLAAGFDHLGEGLLRSGLPVCRIVDEGQRQGMFEFVLWGVLNIQRDFDRALQDQNQNHWQRYPQKMTSDIRVGVMGLGSFGEYVAKKLAEFGYQVFGWSRSPKQIDGVTCMSGSVSTMLDQLDIVVNLLPLNSTTQGILSRDFFNQLPQGAYIINCGRGGHVNDVDLIQAIESGHLRGALLDVFNEEPLPQSNALWSTKGIRITPHMASAASTSAIVKQVVENAERITKGDTLMNEVDLIHHAFK